MASIEVLNMAQINPEEPIEIQLHDSNITYRGPEGPMGPAGRDGVDGARGKSAYEVAVDNGFVGSQVEWLASLKGADGAPGRDGQDGAPGQDGKDGQDGAPGRDGQDGATGPQGPEGPAGKDGQDGAPGQDGQDGVTPVKGVDYFTSADIADIVAQVPAPDLSDYRPVVEINVPNLQVYSSNSGIIEVLTAEQKVLLYSLYTKKLNNDIMPDVWVNGNHIDCFTIGDISQYNGINYRLFTLSTILNMTNKTHIQFVTLINVDDNELFDGRFDYYINSFNAAGVPLTETGNYGGNVNVSSVQHALERLRYYKQDVLEFNTAYNASSNKVATMSDISDAISGVRQFSFEIVTSLPTTNISTSKIYLVLKPTSGTNQVYTEYIYANGDWEILGDTQIVVSALSSQEVQTIWNTASTT